MKLRISKFVFATTLLLGGVNAAIAREPGFYIGASYGTGDLDNVQAFSFSSENTYKAFAGYSFNDYVAVEFEYIDFDEFSDNNTSINSSGGLTSSRSNIDVRGFNFSLVGSYPVTKKLSLFAKAGVFYSDVDISSRINTANSNNSQRVQPTSTTTTTVTDSKNVNVSVDVDVSKNKQSSSSSSSSGSFLSKIFNKDRSSSSSRNVNVDVDVNVSKTQTTTTTTTQNVQNVNSNLQADTNINNNDSERGYDFSFGFGAQYQITENFVAQLQYQSFRSIDVGSNNSDLDLINLGFTYFLRKPTYLGN